MDSGIGEVESVDVNAVSLLGGVPEHGNRYALQTGYQYTTDSETGRYEEQDVGKESKCRVRG